MVDFCFLQIQWRKKQLNTGTDCNSCTCNLPSHTHRHVHTHPYLRLEEEVVFLPPFFKQHLVLGVTGPHHHILYQGIVVFQYSFCTQTQNISSVKERTHTHMTHMHMQTQRYDIHTHATHTYTQTPSRWTASEPNSSLDHSIYGWQTNPYHCTPPHPPYLPRQYKPHINNGQLLH